MDKLIKPTTKGKHDGSCDYLCSEDAQFIVMRGDYTEAEIIQASVSQDVIDSDGAADFASSARYYQCWYKVSPIGGQDGYSGWHHPRDSPCRGAYFASVLQWD
ncbi:hypothetical protein NLF88_000814 [Citrobacter freundii]|nr:hypothetical protein [Citrobacter freundii]EKV0354822.1 hypothetical protein [Citrobacter freundii]EKV0475140.1 hypothetical protein [Citrobacter freundii]